MLNQAQATQAGAQALGVFRVALEKLVRLRPASRFQFRDVLVQKLLALTEQEPDFSSVLELARSLREQVDWEDVRKRTSDSAFAKAYFTLLEELGIV